MSSLPPYVTRSLVAERLPSIFPEGTPNRGYCTREMAASTVFAGLYIGAVDGAGRYFGPAHVYRMSSEQEALSSDADRIAYADGVDDKSFEPVGKRWYQDTTREPIRDETLRDGLVAIGAVRRRDDLPTTSGKPRYALKPDFAALFDPALVGPALDAAITAFHNSHLSKSALARVSIMLSGAAGGDSKVLVTFPSGETRNMEPGPSSLISKAVVEVFGPAFLESPAVLWLSESGNKVVVRDDKLASMIGLKIEADKYLPDLILVDLAPTDPLLVFCEVVATDGAVNSSRQAAFWAMTDAAGFKRTQVAFVTAYRDRQSPGFKKTSPELAWGSFAWFVSEPAHLVEMRNGSPVRLSKILKGS